MPWSQTLPMDQRTQFIADHLRAVLSITELCDLYGVSRKTAYKWIDRYLRQGPAGLEERTRGPHSSLLANLYMRRFVLGWKKLGLDRSLGSRIVTYMSGTLLTR